MIERTDIIENYAEVASVADMNEFQLMKITLKQHNIPFHIHNSQEMQRGNLELGFLSESRTQIYVPFEDFQDAKYILAEAGFENNLSADDNFSSPIIESFKKWVDQIPIVKTWRLEIQLIVGIFLIAMIIIFFAYFIIGSPNY